MLVRKCISLGVFALVFTSPAAYAGSIAFNFSGTSSAAKWSWIDGTSSVSARAYTGSVGPVGADMIPIGGDVLVTFTSGARSGGNGTLSDPYKFGSGGSIEVMGCLPGQGAGCTATDLFKGQFEAELAFAASGYLAFDAPLISGTVNPGIAAMFGLSNVNAVGSFDAVLNCDLFSFGCTTGSDRLLGSADMVLMPSSGPCDSGSCDVATPEPDALQLTALGLLVLMIMVAARRLARS